MNRGWGGVTNDAHTTICTLHFNWMGDIHIPLQK